MCTPTMYFINVDCLFTGLPPHVSCYTVPHWDKSGFGRDFMLHWMAMGLMCTYLSVTGASPVLSLDLSDGWATQSQGPWYLRYDHRDLLVMRHPWTVSQKGDFASVGQ